MASVTDAVTEVVLPALTLEQTAEGYALASAFGNVQVWHKQSQIGLLLPSDDLTVRVNDLIERRRRTLKEVEERTGWKAS